MIIDVPLIVLGLFSHGSDFVTICSVDILFTTYRSTTRGNLAWPEYILGTLPMVSIIYDSVIITYACIASLV